MCLLAKSIGKQSVFWEMLGSSVVWSLKRGQKQHSLFKGLFGDIEVYRVELHHVSCTSLRREIGVFTARRS